MAQNINSSPNIIEKFSSKAKFVTNYYPFTSTIVGREVICKYSVAFEPVVADSSNNVKKKIIASCKNDLEAIFKINLYFANSLFSREKIIETKSVQTLYDNLNYKITFNFLTEVQTYDLEHMHFMKVLLNNLLQKAKFQRIGQKFYDPNRAKAIEGRQLKIWPGFSATVFGSVTSSFVKLDTSSRMANTSSVLVFIQSLNVSGETKNDYILKELKGKTIYTFYNNKTYKIEGVDFSRSPKDTFLMKNEVITLAKYYEKHYSKKIQDMSQPILQSKNKKGVVIELIPELSCMTGLDDAMRSDFTLMKELVKFSDKKPTVRMQECRDLIDTFHKDPVCMTTLSK